MFPIIFPIELKEGGLLSIKAQIIVELDTNGFLFQGRGDVEGYEFAK